MKVRGSIVAALCIFGATGACVNGATDRGDLISLVERVELVPNADSLDALDPTPVGRDWSEVVIHFDEPLTAASIASFDPAADLDLGGLTAATVALNAGRLGLVPPGSLLTIRLAAPPDGIATGTYHLRLISPDANPLVGVSATRYAGEFRFAVSVVVPDGKKPYIVDVRAGGVGETEEIAEKDWEAAAGRVNLTPGFPMPPHGGLHLAFSERMTTPVSVQGAPTVAIATSLSTRLGAFSTIANVVPGLDLVHSEKTITWSDSLDHTTTREVTVLDSDTVEGFEPAQDYQLVFPGDGALTSTQQPTHDVTGEPLTIRFFSSGPAVALVTRALRAQAFRDERDFKTAPVRLSAPAHHSFVNAAAFGASSAPLAIAGQMADTVAAVRLSIAPASAISPPRSPVSATRTVAPDTTRFGVPVDPFSGAVQLAASQPDGDYHLFAEAQDATGVTLGWDVITLTKDATAPTLVSGGVVTLDATDRAVGDFCVTASGDTVKAEVMADVDGNGFDDQDVIATSSAPTPLFLRDDVRFCFAGVPLPSTFRAGRNPWRIRLTDAAGNVSLQQGEVDIRPVLISAAPSLVDFRRRTNQTVILTGVGLAEFAVKPGTVFVDGLPINAPALPLAGPPETLAVTLPAAVAPGPISVTVEGIASNSLPLTVCKQEAPKFVASVPQDAVSFGFERDASGNPVAAWVQTGRVVTATASGGAWSTSSTGGGAARARPGDPLELVRFPDGSLGTVWIAGTVDAGSGISLEARLPGLPPVSIPITGDPGFRVTPRSLSVSFDPATGGAEALVVADVRGTAPAQAASASPTPISTPRPPPHFGEARIYDLVSGTQTANLGQLPLEKGVNAFSGALALGPNGTGVALASSTFTSTWHRTGGVWRVSDDLPGYANDAATAPDGSFAAVLTCPQLGAGGIGCAVTGDAGLVEQSGNLRVFHTVAPQDSWQQVADQPLGFDPPGFRPPNSTLATRQHARLLSQMASIRFTPQGTFRVAYQDPKTRSLNLLLRPRRVLPDGSTLAALVDVWDEDAVTGLSPRLVIDGNGDALMAYVDFSHMDPISATEGPDAARDAEILLVDSRNRNPVSAAGLQTPSLCSPNKFVTSFLGATGWAAIRSFQETRTHLTRNSIALATGAAPVPVTAAAIALRDEQVTAAAGARLLRIGAFSFDGQSRKSGGDSVANTEHAGIRKVDDETRGLHVPVGMAASVVAHIVTHEEIPPAAAGDVALEEAHFASFQPAPPSGCSTRPGGRVDASMAYVPTTGDTVLFGGRGADASTWVLDSSGCWSKSAFTGPAARNGAAMFTAPGPFGGVILFGGFDASGALLEDTWLFVPAAGWFSLAGAGSPGPRAFAASAFDKDTSIGWLFGGEGSAGNDQDLWTFRIVAGLFQWTPVAAAMTPPDARAGASLAVDPVQHQPVVFGGENGGLRNDVWAFVPDASNPDAGFWTQLADDCPTGNCTGLGTLYFGRARRGAAAAFPARWGRLAVLGGQTREIGIAGVQQTTLPGNTLDAFTEDLGAPTWEPVLRNALPVPREGQAWAWDPDHQRLVVFGGRDPDGQILDDTLAFDIQGAPGDAAPQGEWRAIVPGTQGASAVLLVVNIGILGGADFQAGRADNGALLSAFPGGVSSFFTNLGAGAPFPPIKPTASLAVRIDDYHAGPVQFSQVLTPSPDGTLLSTANLGSLVAHGRVLDLGLDMTITTDLPSIPELGCTVFVDPSHPAHAATTHVRPVVDNSLLGVDRSFPELTGVTGDSSVAFRPKVCVQLFSNGVFIPAVTTALAAKLDGFVLIDLLGRFAPSLFGDPASGFHTGPIGGLEGLAGPVVVDAFTNLANPATPSVTWRSVGVGLRLSPDSAEWIHADGSGVALALRRGTGSPFLPPGPIVLASP